MKSLRLIALFMVVLINSGICERPKLIVGDDLSLDKANSNVYHVRPGVTLSITDSELVFQGAGNSVISLHQRLDRRIVGATSNREKDSFGALIFIKDPQLGEYQEIVSTGREGILSFRSNKIDRKVILSRLLSLSRTGRFAFVDVGVYHTIANGEFIVRYNPQVLDLESNIIIDMSDVDSWGEYRDK